MQAKRAPLFVFVAAFFTFMLTFGAVIFVWVKPAREKHGKPGEDATPTVASVASPIASTRPNEGALRKENPESRANPRAMSVRGRAVDSHGAPVTSALALVVSGDERRPEGWNVLRSIKVGADGTFETALDPSTSGFVQVTAQGMQRSDRRALKSGAGPVDLGDLALKPAFSARVRITEEGGQPLPGAHVQLTDASEEPEALKRPPLEATSDGEGLVVFKSADSGRYRVRAHAAGFADAETPLTLDTSMAGRPTETKVALLAARAFIAGTAFDGDHNPIAHGEAVARLVHPPAPAPQEWRASFGTAGEFRIGPLPKGTFEVEISAAGMVQPNKVYAEADGDPVELVVEHGSVVTGKINAPKKLSAMPKLSVWKRDPQGVMQPFDGAFRSDTDPTALTFRIDGLAPGDYQVRIAAAGFAPGRSTSFALKAGATLGDVAVALGDGGIVGGRIVDSRGNPISAARVTAFEGVAAPTPALVDLFPPDARVTGTSGNDGIFQLAGLSPGPHVVVLEAQGQAPRTLGPLVVELNSESKLGTLAFGGGGIAVVTIKERNGKVRPGGVALLTSADGSVRLSLLGDASGNACLRGLAAGDYTLSGADGKSAAQRFTLAGDDTKRLEIKLDGP